MMKASIKNDVVGRKNIIMLLLLTICICFSQLAICQDAGKKIKPRLRLSYTNTIGGLIEVTANVYYIEDGERISCVGAPVGFYTDEEGEELYQEALVDEMGFAILKLDKDALSAFEYHPGKYYFFAQIEKNDRYQSRDEELFITNAEIKVRFIDEDTLKTVQVTLLTMDDSSTTLMPVEGVPIRVYVKRALSLLSIGGDFNYTDDDGMVEVLFPNDIPGNEKGILTVVVKVYEDDEFGTIQMVEQTNWGKAVIAKSAIDKRTLYGARDNAPLFMVISINLILLGIWAYIVYLVYGLYLVKKLGKQD